MLPQNLPPVRPYHPTTFLERGVTVPFTTPLLVGTRARPTYKGGLELVIPNPSGGRGVYILAWQSLASFCKPTLHDRALSERIAALGHVTPGIIRSIARSIAAGGLAGEEAREAALAAGGSDKQARLVANYLLLLALMQQIDTVDPPAPSDPLSATAGPTDMETRAQQAIERVAPRVGRAPEWIVTALEQIAEAMAAIGVADVAAPARVPSLIGALRKVRAEVTDWSLLQRAEDLMAYADMVGAVADFTLDVAQNTLDQARAQTRDMFNLLRSWGADSAELVRLAGRPEWLLDGWEQICLVWNYARDDAGRRAALVEMVQLIPVIPREVLEWSGIVVETEISLRRRRLIPMNEDWRTGAAVFDLIARNEFFRAITFRSPWGG